MRGFICFCILFANFAQASDPMVNWSNYHPLVKERIDRMVVSKDCNGLQKEFDTADLLSDQQRRRTGKGNGSLMGYINYQMRRAGCYA